MRVTSYFNSPESEPSDCGQAIRGSNLSLRHKFGVYLGLTGLGLMGVADAQAQGNPVSHENGVENMNDPMYSAQKLNAGQTVCIDTNAEQGDLVGVTATVTEPSSAGYVNVSSRESSANDGWRKTSNLNYVAGQTIANSMGVVAGPNGEVCATPMTPTHLILDVAGATDASVVTAENPDGSPSRSLDTRNANDQTRGQKLNAGQTVCIDTNAEQGDLVGVTATVTEPSSAGYVNVSSRESSANDGWRKTSNLNYVAGQTIANSMGVVAGPNGEVCATPMTPTHLILDVAGATDASVVTAENPDGSPSRSLDTRNANDQTRGQKLNAGQTVCIDTNAEQGDLVGVTATVTEPSSAGYVNVSSRESSANDGWRKTSNLNYVAGQTIANSMGVVAGPNGEVCATPMTPTHLILDVAGATDASVVTAENPDGSPSRSLDTRIMLQRFPEVQPCNKAVWSELTRTSTGTIENSYVVYDSKTGLFTRYPMSANSIHDLGRNFEIVPDTCDDVTLVFDNGSSGQEKIYQRELRSGILTVINKGAGRYVRPDSTGTNSTYALQLTNGEFQTYRIVDANNEQVRQTYGGVVRDFAMDDIGSASVFADNFYSASSPTAYDRIYYSRQDENHQKEIFEFVAERQENTQTRLVEISPLGTRVVALRGPAYEDQKLYEMVPSINGTLQARAVRVPDNFNIESATLLDENIVLLALSDTTTVNTRSSIVALDLRDDTWNVLREGTTGTELVAIIM